MPQMCAMGRPDRLRRKANVYLNRAEVAAVAHCAAATGVQSAVWIRQAIYEALRRAGCEVQAFETDEPRSAAAKRKIAGG